MNTLVLFDFDGTITKKDSLVDFIKYAQGNSAYYSGLIKNYRTLAAYFLRFISNNTAKERILIHFFEGWDESTFKLVSDQYAIEQIDKIIRSKAMDRIRWHQDQNHKIVIVSASIECWLIEWCRKQELDLVATQLEVKEGRLTGRFASKNCHGAEKVKRLRDKFDLSTFEVIYAYGDSRGDKEMLAIADKSYYKPFR